MSFGGSRYLAAQEYTDSSPEELIVTVPSDARTGLIMLRVANETPVSSTEVFNVFSVTGFSPSSARVGEDVKIWGTGFSSTVTEDSVSFDGSDYVVAVTFIEDTRTAEIPTIDTLMLPVPMEVGKREIRVKVLDGPHATSSGEFEVLPSADRLIDISSLEQLNVIRYDLDGDGAPEREASAYRTAFSLPGTDNNTCPGGCLGYKLTSDLDFNDIDATMMGDQPSIWSENCTDGACQTSTAVDGNNADKVGWAPIGNNSNRFAATFEGNNHTISNLYINRSSIDYIGLFGYLSSGGHVRNLEIEGGSLSGDDYVGGLVGWSAGTVSGCSSSASVTGDEHVGGLSGRNDYGTMSDCSSSGSVTGNKYVGGLVAFNSFSTTSDCSSSGSVTGNDFGLAVWWGIVVIAR